MHWASWESHVTQWCQLMVAQLGSVRLLVSCLDTGGYNSPKGTTDSRPSVWTRWFSFDKFWISICFCLIVSCSTKFGTLAAQSEHAGCDYVRSVRTRWFGIEPFRSGLNTLHKIKENTNRFQQMQTLPLLPSSLKLILRISRTTSWSPREIFVTRVLIGCSKTDLHFRSRRDIFLCVLP